MRHNRCTKRLGRSPHERQALLENLVSSLMRYQSIQTTLAKAKAARSLAEKVITLGKEDTLAAKRKVFSYLQDHELTSKVFKEIAPRFKTRVGGYTRILQLQVRKGDGAQMALFELTEKEIKVKEPPKSKKKKAAKDDKTKPGTSHTGAAEHTHADDAKSAPETHHKPSESPKNDKSKKGFLKGFGGFFKNKGGV